MENSVSESTKQGKSKLPKETQDLILAAESGDLSAQFRLGVHYRNGDAGLLQDLSQAHHWIIMAARSGHIHAQVLEGLLLLKEGGWGGPTPPSQSDEWKALYWFREAAEQGHEGAKSRFMDLLTKKAAVDHCDLLCEEKYITSDLGLEHLDRSSRIEIEDPVLRGIFAEVDAVCNAWPRNCYWILTCAIWEGRTAVFTLATLKIIGAQCPSCRKMLNTREVHRQVWSNHKVGENPVRIEFLHTRFRCEIHGVIPAPLPAGLQDTRGQWEPSFYTILQEEEDK
jgi:hypothetical protein